ncbi:MAG: acyltransferase [Clostridia bacterium]|nr:acyltransferase [Clostridia bacterium]
MSEVKTKARNSSIDIFRYVCAVFIVIIHTHPLTDFGANADYASSQILTRIGVPFFFAVAGYFYTQKLEKGQIVFIPYIKKLFATYFIWSCLYFFTEFISWGHNQIKGFILSSAINFFIKGSYYHFWFFPALIICVCITTVFFKIKWHKALIPLSIVLYIIGCLGCSYYELGTKIPVLSTLYSFSDFTVIRRIFFMGFPFFVSGYFVSKIKDKILEKTSNFKLFMLLIFSIVIWLAEIYTVIKLSWQTNIIITFGLYFLVIVVMLLLLNNPLPQFCRLSEKSRIIANFTYYAHPLFMLIIKSVYSDTPKILLFLLTLFLTFVCGLILSKFNNKFIKLITG